MGYLKAAVLFPLRSSKDKLIELKKQYPFDFFLTPYLESTELRSNRGLNNGINDGFFDEPNIPESFLTQWSQCNVIIAMDIPSRVIELFPDLEWVQGVSAGHDHINVNQLKASGIKFTSAKGIASAAISEFVFARLLQEVKYIRHLDQQQQSKTWQVKFGNQLKGKTIGIVGVGSIGTEIAKRAKAFEMNVLGIRERFELGSPDFIDNLFPFSQLDALLGKSDVIVMATPSTKETENLFNASKFSKMKKGSIFINIARGAHVVESDLANYLRNGHLRAAILDVVRNEPLDEASELWSAPNLYLSPHCSVSFDDYEANAIDLFIENVRRTLEGEELVNRIF